MMNSEIEYLKTRAYYKQLIKLINYDDSVKIDYFIELYYSYFDLTFLRLSLKYYSDKLINKKFVFHTINNTNLKVTFFEILENKFDCMSLNEYKQFIELYYKYGGKYIKVGPFSYEKYDMICKSLYLKIIYSKIFVRYWIKKIFHRRRIIYMIALIKSNIKLSDDIIEEFIIFTK